MTNFTELPDSIRDELPHGRRVGPNEPLIQSLLAGKTLFLPGLTAVQSKPVPTIRTAIYVRTNRKGRLVGRFATVDGESGVALWIEAAA